MVKKFHLSGIGSLDSIMVLKKYSRFRYVHNSWFLGQFKDTIFMFKMSVDLGGSRVIW